MATRGPLYIARTFKSGNSMVIAIERDLREALGLRPGDSVMIRLHAPYATLRRAEPHIVMPLSDLHTEDFPPAWPNGGKVAAQQDSTAPTVDRTARPDAGDDERRSS